jgi:ABC-type multidrug transport system fused ATPase/permease subunit
LRPQRLRAIVLGILLLLQIGVQLSNPQVLRIFIDRATRGAPFDRLVQLAGLFILIVLAREALVVCGTYLSQDVGWTATNELRYVVAEHCLGLDMAFHKTSTPGEWIERIDGDLTALANFFSQFVMLDLGNMLLLGGVISVTWLQDWRVGLCRAARGLPGGLASTGGTAPRDAHHRSEGWPRGNRGHAARATGFVRGDARTLGQGTNGRDASAADIGIN